MRPSRKAAPGRRARWVSCGWVSVAACSACFPDSVASGVYGSTDDAAAEASAPVSSSSASSSAPSASTNHDGDAPSSDAGATLDGADAWPTTTVGCDLGGRWMATDREVATADGAKEAAHEWMYFELSQAGAGGTVAKGLDCGQDVRGLGGASANVDYPKVWPSLQTHISQAGRKFTSAVTASGCSVAFDEFYQVLGATLPFYQDPSQTLPTASQQAMGGTPGWEDWDGDGHPGITMNVSGLATGQIYVVTRSSSTWSGTIAAGASTFTLADVWNTEQDLLGYNGSALLTATTTGTRDNVPSEHFVVFARLDPTQATGDDTAVCAAVRSLAATLTPSATN